MFKLVVFCTFVVVIQGGVTLPKKVVLQKTLAGDLVEEITNIRTNVENSITNIVPDTHDATKLLLTLSTEFANSVERTTKSIKSQVKNAQGVIDNGINEFTSKLENSARKLKHLTDIAVLKANQITAVIEVQVKNIFDEVQGALKTNLLYAHGHIKKYADKFFNDVISAGKALQLNLTLCEEKPKK
ncbi:hypothetical protein FQR65_LT00086 [Abscondita terminalis]|nr:hypothetical protein FQR65_LT00086 [Abscondita terminalis]